MFYVKSFKREFVYSVLLFIIWELSQIQAVLGLSWLYWVFVGLGVLAVATWCISSYFLFAYKHISRYSDALIKVHFRERFFIYFLLPIILQLTVSAYLYYTKNPFLKQTVILSATILFFMIFIHIRTSYSRITAIARSTRIVFSMIDLLIYYALLSSLLFLFDTSIQRIFIATALAFLLLAHQLLLHKQDSVMSVVVLLLSTIFICVMSVFFVGYGSYTFPLLMCILFYLVVSLWNVRLEGKSSSSEYLPPFFFSLMAILVVISF